MYCVVAKVTTLFFDVIRTEMRDLFDIFPVYLVFMIICHFLNDNWNEFKMIMIVNTVVSIWVNGHLSIEHPWGSNICPWKQVRLKRQRRNGTRVVRSSEASEHRSPLFWQEFPQARLVPQRSLEETEKRAKNVQINERAEHGLYNLLSFLRFPEYCSN